jgi:SAM-dependent methyltransferase
VTDRGTEITGAPANEPDQVLRLFDAKAADWPAKYAPHGPLTNRLAQFTDALAYHVPMGGRMLDLGCGSGELALAAVRAGLRVTACDISSEMLRRAADGDLDNDVTWMQLDPGWQRLPFEAAFFHVVVASSILEYVGCPRDVLYECARVLRPGGLVLCTVPDITHPVRWLEWALSQTTRAPLGRTTGGRWPRIEGYLTYLRISRHRRTAKWWQAEASRAGLLAIPNPLGAVERTPLRLLMFRRPISTLENS